MSTAAPRPVTAHLLTGFLGSGKTTLLRRILHAPGLENTAVLVNEFGEIGLDHLLLETVDEDVVLLQSGCACCTIRGDLKKAVLRLFDRRRQASIPVFDRLIIETTGLADPGPIVATFASDPMLRHQIALGSVVTVVDAVHGGRTLDLHSEAVKQVAVADRLVVTKTDLAEPEAIAALKDRLRTLNPAAVIGEHGEDQPVAVDELLTSVADPGARQREVAHWFDFEALEHRHGLVTSLSLTIDEPLDWAAFALWLGMLLNRHGRQVLRVKGILQVQGSDQPVVIHGVQHTIHPPLHLDAWPDGSPRTRLVLIVDDLDPALIERSFRAFMALG